MGVRGLFGYVRNNDVLSISELSNRTVIIDGNNICHYLYDSRNNEFFPGSDYSFFATKCRRYFQALKQCGVKTYVVFDGGLNIDYRHFGTTLARRQKQIDDTKNERYGNMPIFGDRVLLQVLDELRIPYVRTQFEADKDIAVLAHKWGCPVMSNDSDFFIYQLEEGCIPFPCINSSTLLENKSIPIQLYQYRLFVKQKQVSTDLLPLMATVMGNDYVNRTILLQLFRKMRWFDNYKRPDDILSWLNTFRESSDTKGNVLRAVLRGNDATKVNENAFNLAIADYRLDKFSSFDLDNFFKAKIFQGANLDDYYGNRLPAWFTEGFHSCTIGRFLQDVFVHHRIILTCQGENVELPSSYFCSRYIRQCIYGIAVASAGPGNLDIFIVEHDRKEDKCWPFVVMPVREVRNFGKLPDLNTIPDMLVKDRRRLFLACFNVEPRHLQGIDMKDAVVSLILGLSFWMKHARPEVSEKHIDALLMCIIYLHLKSLVFKEKYPNSCSSILKACTEIGEVEINTIEKGMYIKYDQQPNQEWDKTTLHIFAQFYSCCSDISKLNEVLKNPLCVASPIVSFNSKFAYNFYMDLVATGKPAAFLSGFSRGTQSLNLLRLFTMLKSKVISLTQV